MIWIESDYHFDNPVYHLIQTILPQQSLHLRGFTEPLKHSEQFIEAVMQVHGVYKQQYIANYMQN